MTIVLPENHIFMTAEQDLKKICAPLFKKTEISFFDYGRFFDDGSCYLVSSNNKIIPYLFNLDTCFVAPFPPNIGGKKFHYLLPTDGVYSQIMHEVSYFFNFAYGINFVESGHNYIDFFCFGTKQNNDKIINFYLNNIDLLENFLLYFKEKAARLFNTLNDRKILLPAPMRITAPPSFNQLKTLVIKNKPLPITKREMDCLDKLIEGYSAKEIAQLLSLSRRTVEDHIQNAKAKLGCSKRSEIFQILRQQRLF